MSSMGHTHDRREITTARPFVGRRAPLLVAACHIRPEYRRILAAEIKGTDLGRRRAPDVRRPDVRQFLEVIAERPPREPLRDASAAAQAARCWPTACISSSGRRSRARYERSWWTPTPARGSVGHEKNVRATVLSPKQSCISCCVPFRACRASSPLPYVSCSSSVRGAPRPCSWDGPSSTLRPGYGRYPAKPVRVGKL